MTNRLGPLLAELVDNADALIRADANFRALVGEIALAPGELHDVLVAHGLTHEVAGEIAAMAASVDPLAAPTTLSKTARAGTIRCHTDGSERL